MTYLALNGRPVIVGTQLTFINDAKCLTFNMDYLTVERISSSRGIDYITNTGADGSVSLRDLPTLFKHYDPVKVQKLTDRQYLFNHITDLFNVPEDRIDDCLDEMKHAIRTLHLARTAAITVFEENADCKFTEEDVRTFTRHHIGNVSWNDDGANSTTVNIDQDKIVTTINETQTSMQEMFTFRPTLHSQPASPLTPPSLEVMVEAYFESQNFDIVTADKLKKEYLHLLHAKALELNLKNTIKIDAKVGEIDPMDVFAGDSEYYITNVGLEAGSSLMAYSQDQADAKVKHHYGPDAKAEWRKYTG